MCFAREAECKQAAADELSWKSARLVCVGRDQRGCIYVSSGPDGDASDHSDLQPLLDC